MTESVPMIVRLFTAPSCPHCNGMKVVLQQLVEEGQIDNLNIVDITQQPELAAELGIRSVPWLEMGSLTFSGEQTLKELRVWAKRLTHSEAMADYYQKLLAEGDLGVAEQMLQRNPETLATLLSLMVRKEQPLQVRIGTVALFEGFSGKAPLQALIPELSEQLMHRDYRIRADIAHLLELTESKEAIAPLRRLLQDENSEVREIAGEAIEELEAL